MIVISEEAASRQRRSTVQDLAVHLPAEIVGELVSMITMMMMMIMMMMIMMIMMMRLFLFSVQPEGRGPRMSVSRDIVSVGQRLEVKCWSDR